MGLRNVIHSGSGQIIISILLGLGLSTLFRRSCNNRSCIIFQAVNLIVPHPLQKGPKPSPESNRKKRPSEYLHFG